MLEKEDIDKAVSGLQLHLGKFGRIIFQFPNEQTIKKFDETEVSNTKILFAWLELQNQLFEGEIPEIDADKKYREFCERQLLPALEADCAYIASVQKLSNESLRDASDKALQEIKTLKKNLQEALAETSPKLRIASFQQGSVKPGTAAPHQLRIAAKQSIQSEDVIKAIKTLNILAKQAGELLGDAQDIGGDKLCVPLNAIISNANVRFVASKDLLPVTDLYKQVIRNGIKETVEFLHSKPVISHIIYPSISQKMRQIATYLSDMQKEMDEREVKPWQSI